MSNNIKIDSFFKGLISYMGSPKPFSLICGYFFKETRFCGNSNNYDFLWVPQKQNAFVWVTLKPKHLFVGNHNAGRRTDFREQTREVFSGELFSGELFSGAALLPENFVPINVCGVDSFSPN